MANSLSEFEKVVFVHRKVNIVSGTCHTIGRNRGEQYLHRRRKRNQEHDNKATYSNPCSKDIHPHGEGVHSTPPDGHEVQRETILSGSREISTSGVQSSRYKADRTPYTKQ